MSYPTRASLLRLCALTLSFAGAVEAAQSAPSIAEATPAEATDLFFVEPIRGNLEMAVDAMDALFGPMGSEAFLEQAPLPALALQVLAGVSDEHHGIDPARGLGLFHVRGYEGAVGLISASDGPRALAAVRSHLLGAGGRRVPPLAGTEAVTMPDGARTYLLAARGYLYVVMPDAEDGAAERGLGTEAVLATLRQSAFRPLLATDGWRRAVREPSQLAALNFFSLAEEGAPLGADAALITLRSEGRRLVLGGHVATRAPVRMPPADASHLALAPEKPVVVGSLWFEPELLSSSLLGPTGSWRRRVLGSRVEALGVDAEQLFASLGGRASVLAYFDSELYWMGFLEDELPLPVSTLLLESSLKARAPLERYVTARAAEGVKLRRTRAAGESRYVAPYAGGELSLRVSERRALLTLGDPRPARPKVKLLSQLRARFGQETFGPGHASLLVDLRALREELARPIDLEGLSAEEAELLQRFGGLLLWQTGPIDHVFVDVGATPAGLAIRGEITFEPGAPAPQRLGRR